MSDKTPCMNRWCDRMATRERPYCYRCWLRREENRKDIYLALMITLVIIGGGIIISLV